MSWFGRQLRTYSKGSISANFVYDADGLRSAKAVNGTTTTYQYVGDQLFYEKIGENKILYYFYDSYGKLAAIYYTYKNGSNVSSARYHVATNAQGDVIALYNSNGVKVGAYDYDAWGNQRVFVVTQNSAGANVHTQINPETEYLNHIVNVNPMRYRGYYYDRDLGLYYLQSRYYDSGVGRFINADGYISTGQGVLGYNMYAYCGNNPIINSDSSGESYADAYSRNDESANSIFGLFITTIVAWIVCRMYPTATRALPRYSTQRYSSPSISIPKAEEKAEVIPKTPPSDSTVIYRYGGTNPGNLTPSQRDVDLYPITGKGLSFSTVPKPGAAKTTIEALNSTGVVYAVCDGGDHVSVYPIGGTLADWRNAGSSSVWTTAVKSVVVKWDGGN